MSDKDQFTFEDDDDFPETDLSAAFSDGEREADIPTPEVEEETFFPAEEEPETDAEYEPEPAVAAAAAAVPKKAKKEKKPKKEKKAGSGGSSRTRGLLLVLLLVIGGAAGAYYFMDLGGTTPAVPTVPTPAKKAVALPPKPAQAPAPATQSEPAKPVKVAVPPPPPPPPAKVAEDKAAKPAEQAAPAPQQVKVEPPRPAPAQPPVMQPKPEPVKEAEQAKTATKIAAPTPPVTTAAEKKAEKPVAAAVQLEPEVAKPVAAPKQVADGAFALDAGSYLFESNRDALIAKIKALGYEPKVTPVDATLDMTRLRLGTFSKSEVQEALDMARAIEPGSYSSPAGDQYVIYAGTFLGKGNIDKLTKRFNDEGIKVYPEPVQVVRTLSRIRFGSFATKEDASQAAVAVVGDGIKAVVVKSK